MPWKRTMIFFCRLYLGGGWCYNKRKSRQKGDMVMVNNYERHVELMQRNLGDLGLKTNQVSEETKEIIYRCKQPFHKEGKMFETIWED